MTDLERNNLSQLKGLLNAESTKKRFFEILGSKSAGFISSILNVVNGNPALQEADPNTVLMSAAIAATLDLPVNPNLGFAALVPYKEKGRAVAQFQMMWRGFVQLAQRSGQYRTLNTTTVYEGEIKRQNRFTGEIEFDPDGRKSDKVVGYVAYMSLLNGFEKYFYMSREECEKHAKRYSKTYQKGYGKWKEDFDAMAMKGLALDTPIPTPEGFKTMGDLAVGDTVYNALGEETNIIAKSEVKELPCYEVEFLNGDTIVCDEEHRWFVKGRTRGGWTVVETKDLYAIKQLGYPVMIPHTEPVKMRKQKLIIDPYVLGYWLGNGSKCAACVACHSDDSEEITGIFSEYYNVSAREDDRSNTIVLNISSKTGSRSDMSSLKQQLKEIGVFGNKHIPMIYKRGSIEQRIELVRGLCDSDGCIDNLKRGRCVYGSVKQGLVEDMYEILCSLGERVSFHSKIARGYGTTTTYFEVDWKPRNFNPFRLKRKAERVKGRLLYPSNSIKTIRKIESVPTQCIAVDSGEAKDETDLRKSFLVGYGFNPTHNTVLKLLISKYGIMSVDMQKAVEFDQSTVHGDINNIEDATPEYVDNEQPAIESTKPTPEEMQANYERVKDDPKAAEIALAKGEISIDLFNQVIDNNM